MRLACDIDGVLADYRTAYYQLLREIEPATIETPASSISSIAQTGQEFSKAARDTAFRIIEASDEWWMQVPAYDGTRAALERMAEADVLYFLTKRFGRGVQAQTAYWLEAAGAIDPSAVIIVDGEKLKGQLATTLRVDALIDDQAACLNEARSARGFLVERPWNQQAGPLCRGHLRVKTVHAALDQLDL